MAEKIYTKRIIARVTPDMADYVHTKGDISAYLRGLIEHDQAKQERSTATTQKKKPGRKPGKLRK